MKGDDLPLQISSFAIGHDMHACHACRLSEQRVHDLLEGMCEAVAKKSTLFTTSWTGGPGSRMWSSSATRDPSVPENGTWAEPPRAEKDGGCLACLSD